MSHGYLGHLRAEEAGGNDGTLASLAHLTGLSVEAVGERLRSAPAEAPTREVFSEEWPSSPEAFADCTLAFVRRWNLQEDLQRALGVTAYLVTRRLNTHKGKTLVRNAFKDRWPEQDGEALPAAESEAESEPSFGGSEVDEEDSGTELITKPFDPNLIRVRLWTPTVDLVMKRLQADEIDLAPDFQRAAGIWKDRAQSQLIESLLIRIPLPAFYMDASNEDQLVVVDGIQRLTALRRFLIDRDLALSGLEYLTELNDKTVDDLPRPLVRRLEETMLTVYLIEKGTPERAKLNIFKRLNTGGQPLTAQEIRHAMHPGPVRAYLKSLALSGTFLEATERRFSDDRMTARECALRFCAFVLTPPPRYPPDADLDSFLHAAMSALNDVGEARRRELAGRFDRAMKAARDILGNQAFRKPRAQGARSLVNKALFEAWAVGFDGCTDEALDRVGERTDVLARRFREVFESNREFDKSLSQGTGDRRKVQLRFATIADLLTEVSQ